jgi:hypothetical protein
MRSAPRTLAALLSSHALAALAALATLGGAGCTRAAATAADPERAAITEAVELYFQGHATGDGAFMTRAFAPEAKLFWVKDGALAQRTAAEFAAGFSGKPAADEAARRRRILLLDRSGDAALAKVELDYPGGGFIDYLALLKLEGRWQIVNKIFHRRAAPPALPSKK